MLILVLSIGIIEWNLMEIMINNLVFVFDIYMVYIVIIMVGSCVWVDLFVIQVDLLFVDMIIIVDLFDDLYCVGELVILIFLIYDLVDYLNMMYDWFVVIGDEMFDILYNMVIFMVDIFIYQCLIVNGGCI